MFSMDGRDEALFLIDKLITRSVGDFNAIEINSMDRSTSRMTPGFPAVKKVSPAVGIYGSGS